MIIHLHPLLRTPILTPYRELARFGLTTESSQIEVNKIDMRASFEIEDKSLLVSIRQPNWRIRIDFFCFAFANAVEVAAEFIHTAELDHFAAAWLAAATENPNAPMLLHRLACFYQSRAWELCGKNDFDGMFSALHKAIPCWAMVLHHTDYISQWREARYQAYGSKTMALMFAGELVEELAKTIDAEIKKILQLSEVIGFSRVRSDALIEAFEREMLDLQTLHQAGGLLNKSGAKAVCGPLGVKLFKLQTAAYKRADVLEKLHPTPQQSYLRNIKLGVTADEKLAFRDVQNFRLAFFELGQAFFNMRKGKVWQAFVELSRLAGAESLENVQSLDVPHGSLLYLPVEEGRQRFEKDFWYLAAEICKLALSQEILKEQLNYDQVRSSLRRIISLIQHIPNRDELMSELEEMFLARHFTLLENPRLDELRRAEQGVRLLEIFMSESQETNPDAKIAKAIGSAAGNIAAMLANKNRLDDSIKYFNRCLTLAPGEFDRISEAVYIYERKIQQTRTLAEKISYYRRLVEILKKCAPHHEGNQEFEKLLKTTELKFDAMREARSSEVS